MSEEDIAQSGGAAAVIAVVVLALVACGATFMISAALMAWLRGG